MYFVLNYFSLNIPTVCFYDPEVYKFRPEVDYFVNKFNDNGVFHQDGESAANFINKTNIDDWWNQTDVQLVRKSFINNYSNFSQNWTHPWEL